MTKANLTYDFMGRLTDLKHTNSANVIQDRFELTYDAGSRITSVVTTPTGANVPAFTTSFSYDSTNQLTGVTSPLQGESYSFDLAGNRKTSTAGTASQSYTTKDNRITNDGKYSYVYDKEANLLSKRHLATGRTTFYTWDYRNRLTRVETRATSSPTSTLLMQAVYVYDVFDRRISKDVDSDGAGPAVTTREAYVYDGPHITIEFRDSDASGPQPSALSARRLYGPAVDQILAEEQYPAGGGPSSVYWPLTDWLGSVRDLVNSSGAVGKYIDYDSFGNVIRVTDGSGNPSTLNAQPSTRILWTGREFDSESKLQYNRARYYDAAIGRWLSEDPIGFAGGDANLYRYVGNSSSNFVDPNGQEQQRPRRGGPVAMSQAETDRFREAEARRPAEEARMAAEAAARAELEAQFAEYHAEQARQAFLAGPFEHPDIAYEQTFMACMMMTGEPPELCHLMAEEAARVAEQRLFEAAVVSGVMPSGGGPEDVPDHVGWTMEEALFNAALVAGALNEFACLYVGDVGDARDLCEAAVGRSMYGEKLSPEDRALTAAAAGAPFVSGSMVRLGRRLQIPLSQLAKRRLAKEIGCIARSAQPVAQGRYGDGLMWWEYKDAKGKIKIVVEHSDGTVHVGRPKPQSTHRQGGPPKYYPEPGSGHVAE